MIDDVLGADLDVKGLRLFLTVLEAGSMTEAARQLHMTQSAVSQAIARFEAQVQVPLLDRTTRPFTVTDAGQVLAERGPQIIDAAAGVLRDLRHTATMGRPRVRMGLIDSVAGTIGAALIRGIRSEVREVSVWSGISPVLRQDVEQGRLDLVVTTDPALLKSGHRVRLMQEPLIGVVPANFAKRHDGPIDPMKMSELLPLVRYSERSVIGAEIETILRRRKAVPPRVFEFDGSDGVFTMVSEGLGWAITTPLCLLHGRKFGRNVVARALAGPTVHRDIHLLATNALGEGLFERIEKNAIGLFRDFLADHESLLTAVPAKSIRFR